MHCLVNNFFNNYHNVGDKVGDISVGKKYWNTAVTHTSLINIWGKHNLNFNFIFGSNTEEKHMTKESTYKYAHQKKHRNC